MSSRKNPDVKYLKEKVGRFHWKYYKIGPKTNESDFITLYWYCVTSDMINQYERVQKGNVGEKEVRNELGHRLYHSFLGCFFKAHELYHGLLGRFEGFNILKHDQERIEWKSWKDKLLDKTWEEFLVLWSICIRNYNVREGVYSDLSIQSHDVIAFDDVSPKIPQKASSVLIPHLKNGTMNAHEPGTMNAKFLFKLKDRVINQLHNYGLQYVKARMTCELMNDIDGRFENGKQVITSQEKLKEHQSIKDAILDLFKRWPEFKDYSNLEVASVVKEKYKDSDGTSLNISSITRALDRMDKKERRG